MPSVPSRAGNAAKFAVRALITVALLLLVFSRVDLGDFWQIVRTARWQFLLGVWASAALFFWVQSAAMKLILRKQDCQVSLHTIFGASCITALYSLVLPGILSTGVKWYVLTRDTGKGSNVLSSMLYNQVTLSVVMVVVGLAGLIVTNPTRVLFPGEPRQWLLPLLCGLVLALVVLTIVLVLHERTGGVIVRLSLAALRPLPQAMQETGRRVLTQIAVFQTAGWRFHLTIASLNAVNAVVVSLLMYLCAARAAGVVAPIGVLVWLGAIVYILGRLPISVANLGVREVTLVVMLAGYGVAEPAALLMSVILFSSQIFLAAIGVLYQVLWAVRAKRPIRKPGAPESIGPQ